MDELIKLQEIIDKSENIVFFGGAGVSTESGVPDFRSVDGLYNQKYDYPPEEILSHTFFMNNTKEFYKFYREKMLLFGAKPNKAHLKLSELENKGKLLSVVTQNIDGLHQMAGSIRVHELHGSVHRNYCMKCHKFYSGEDILNMDLVPLCECGGIIKPDVVLYEEPLNDLVVEDALLDISKADTMIIAGTSLAVYPAASYIRYFRGNNIILINLQHTSFDSKANLVIHDRVGEVLSKIEIK